MLRGSSWSTALALLLTVWASPASPICTSKDWFASFSSCVANQRSVTYQWRLPKNCGDVGNLPPSGRTVPRAIISVHARSASTDAASACRVVSALWTTSITSTQPAWTAHALSASASSKAGHQASARSPSGPSLASCSSCTGGQSLPPATSVPCVCTATDIRGTVESCTPTTARRNVHFS